MFIQTEATPNPATLKFLPGQAVLEAGTLDMPDREAAAQSPLAQRLFDIPNVARRVLRRRFHLGHQDRGRLAAAQAGDPRRHHGALHDRRAAHRRAALRRRRPAATSSSTKRILRRSTLIKDLIETRVRPAVAGDGGDIVFKGYKEGVVFLTMKGACSGCPSSTATLQHGIQNLLRHFVPEVVEVRPM